MSLSTPVTFIIFNRPDLTEIVFEAIRQAKPKKLLVIADGPRFPEEAEKCEKARAVIKRVDWQCDVLTNFSDVNLGCKYRVSSGLEWVFSEVEEAIILEDDCLPAPSFFYFCQTLLDYYRHDERIMHIGGNNFDSISINKYSYYVSKYNYIWGWASWRRAWKHYDVEMKNWSQYKDLNLVDSICDNTYEKKYWTDIFNKVSTNSIDTWDYQWTFACWSQSGLSIIPSTNLVSNIGFRSDATHTLGDSPLANLEINDIWSVKHPQFIMRNITYDRHIFDKVYGGQDIRDQNQMSTKIIQKLSNVKNYMFNLVT